ncbi:hypothetical protein [Melghirimyces algeriensis]|uniref:Uncharacterized protein n=1 Tax=Melghirimyces algeriensis TaxID=910412 RepID=A0A521ELY6_9BACL|nr:hypothetical protein [Melghirimyces algeriensis]SMO84461.1 hypothetical protein SAMN06264849_109135 [Melghirimyces algeriensis]
MSEKRPVIVLRVTNLNQSFAFYRELGFDSDWEDLVRKVVCMSTPVGDLLLVADPDLDVKLFLDTLDRRQQDSIPENSYYPFEVREVRKEEVLRFPKENLLLLQKRLAHWGVSDLLLEETPAVEQVLNMRDPDGYRVALYESLRLPDEEIIDLYRKGPDLLEGAILGLEDEELDLETEEGDTIRQILLQIVDFDLEMMQRMKWALAENGRSYTITLYNPEDWMEKLEYASRPVHTEIHMFRLLREHFLNQLEIIPGAMDHYLVSEQGKVEVRTMMQVTAETAWEQIQILMSTRHIRER